jgi:deoxyguanosine kinase
MLEITILEGARGTGKSTLAFKLRQKTSPTPTLINFTGFHDEGHDGFLKVSRYYEAFMKLLSQLYKHDSQMVFDRFYFSEAVYSQLYKDYDFSYMNEMLNNCLIEMSEKGVKINIFFLTINNEEELKQRLIRDKVPFGKAQENVEETLKQQDMYREVFMELEANYLNSNLKIHTIDTSGKTNDDVYAEILTLKTT